MLTGKLKSIKKTKVMKECAINASKKGTVVSIISKKMTSMLNVVETMIKNGYQICGGIENLKLSSKSDIKYYAIFRDLEG